ncbi:PLP-dependent aminotransferase family protein [Corynebacterium sp. UBA2622]|uniref:MocR-like pyridoxine biosynthesis transcription factor PdxR n=1 Tax=Corynebacterium sp. UBA2622 TaxID=1946393 RepID=UPI0025BBA490|nr:PLP-dependent aminotransferase family protein [Corynebacterium sp. UBA2622]
MFTVDRLLPTPLPVQIAAGMRELVSTGRLAAGDRVPSTRDLAARLGVSRGSVVSAYDQLLSEGFLLSSQGAPTIIHPELVAGPRLPTPRPRTTGPRPARGPARISLKPSSANAGTIRPAAWRRAWRVAAAEPASGVDKSGEPALRHAIADHLRLSRGLAVDPDDVLVTGGSREGLLLILMALGHGLRVGVEDPGHPGLCSVIPLAGHSAVTCGTDEMGVVVAELPEDLDALLVTPSHLYPLGGPMPAPRRSALIEWAAGSGTVLIEDDFNAELRYRVSPQPTLSTVAGEAAVVTLGTFSTLLSRQLAAGYVVADADTIDMLRETRELLGMPVSAVTQRAIAHLLAGGYVRRNTRSVHSQLLRRREVIRERVLPALLTAGATVLGASEGVGADVAIAFTGAGEKARFERFLASCGLICSSLPARGTGREEGFILSFAHLKDEEFTCAVDLLCTISTR